MTDIAAAQAPEDNGLGKRANRTREAILDATRRLFLDRGFAGTRISNITDACGISRAGFYTYFKDKREIFAVLGQAAYHDFLGVITRWETIPTPCSDADIAAWVRVYFSYMDVHGAFILSSSHSAPDDEEFRAAARRLEMRSAWLLGTNLRQRQAVPTDAPEALGLMVVAMLDRCWFQRRVQQLPVSEDDLVDSIVGTLGGVLDNGART
jgi:TetR/AcrR family transcriptional regulator